MLVLGVHQSEHRKKHHGKFGIYHGMVCVSGEHSGLACLSRDLGIRCKKSDFRVVVILSISKRGEELRLRSTSSMIATLVPI